MARPGEVVIVLPAGGEDLASGEAGADTFLEETPPTGGEKENI